MTEYSPVLTSPNSSKELAEYVRKQLEACGFKFSASNVEDVEVLFFRGTKFEITVNLYCGDGYLTVHSCLPFIVSKSAMHSVLGLANALNKSRPVGSYEVDDAEKIVFKIGCIVPPLPTSDQLVVLLNTALENVDSKAEEFLAIAS